MTSTNLSRPYPFTVRPAHLETTASYSARLLQTNFEGTEHRRVLERLANEVLPELTMAERWMSVLESKAQRSLALLESPRRPALTHRDGSDCPGCSDGISHRVLCKLCANGSVVEQHPHLDNNVCLTHRRWIGPDTEASEQITVGDDAIRAETVFRKLRRTGRVDVPLYMLIQNAAKNGAKGVDMSTLYPQIIDLISTLTSEAFGLKFFDPTGTFSVKYDVLSTAVANSLGGPNKELTAVLWLRFRATVLSQRESIERRLPYNQVGPHDLPIHPSVAARYQTHNGTLEPFEEYLTVMRRNNPASLPGQDLWRLHLYAPSTSKTKFSQATICEKGHRSSRTEKSACQACEGRTLHPGFNDLDTIRPDISRLWHPTRNGTLTARDVFPASHKKVWWLCDDGHDFPATPSNLTSGNSTCSVCQGRRIQAGVNDLATLFPAIAAEWNFEKNVNHDITTIAAGSNHLVWWICPVGHTYRKTVGNRTRGGNCHQCPRIASRARTLAVARPDLAKQFHPTKNLPLTIDTITIGSRRLCHWTCPDGHDYTQFPERRNAGYGCPYCSGQKFERGTNDFATMFPALATEWDSRLNGVIEPTDHVERSRKIIWTCKVAGHVHSQTVLLRIKSNGCPLCEIPDRIGSRAKAS